MTPSNFLILIKKQLFLLKSNIIASSVVALVFCFFFGLRFLSNDDAQGLISKYFVLCGIIVLTSIFHPEENSSIYEIISVKSFSLVSTLMLRFLISFCYSFLLFSIILILMRLYNNSILFYQNLSSALVSVCAVSSIGLLGNALTNERLFGLLVSAIYYLLAITLKFNTLPWIMPNPNNPFKAKFFLFVISLIIIFLSSTIQTKRYERTPTI